MFDIFHAPKSVGTSGRTFGCRIVIQRITSVADDDSLYLLFRLIFTGIYWIREYAHKALEELQELHVGTMTRWIARVFRERCELCGHVMSNHNIQPNGLGECNTCRRINGQCQLEPYRNPQPIEVEQLTSKRRLFNQLDKRLRLRVRNIRL